MHNVDAVYVSHKNIQNINCHCCNLTKLTQAFSLFSVIARMFDSENDLD